MNTRKVTVLAFNMSFIWQRWEIAADRGCPESKCTTPPLFSYWPVGLGTFEECVVYKTGQSTRYKKVKKHTYSYARLWVNLCHELVSALYIHSYECFFHTFLPTLPSFTLGILQQKGTSDGKWIPLFMSRHAKNPSNGQNILSLWPQNSNALSYIGWKG